jgi:hypothetical protein
MSLKLNIPSKSELTRLIPQKGPKKSTVHTEESYRRFMENGKDFTDDYVALVSKALEDGFSQLLTSKKTTISLTLNPSESLTSKSGGKLPFHVVHYGGYPVIEDGIVVWHKRTQDERFIPLPFKKIQQELLEKGYYLYDLSDPSKGKGFIIVLSLNPLKGAFKNLWHGFNSVVGVEK